MGHSRTGMALLAVFASITVAITGCGYAPALQSALETPTLTLVPTWTVGPAPTTEPAPTATQRIVIPTEEPPATPADTATPTEIPTITQTPTPGPSPTPDTRETSVAVFATITALAATPTYPPTSTPRPRRTPIGAGPGDDIPPTALFTSGGIAVLMLSQRVYPGAAAALTIKTKPAARCTVQIARGSGGAPRLEPIPSTPTRVAGQDGSVAWLWTIAGDEPAGIMNLVVNCGAAGKAQVQIRVME